MSGEKIEPKEKLKRVRKRFRWSQERTDKIAGVIEGRTYSYERNPPRARPSRDYLQAISDYANQNHGARLTPEWFFDGVDDDPPMAENQDKAPAPTGLPLLGDIPGSMEGGSVPIGSYPVKATFPLPPSAHYRRIGDRSKTPILQKGDLILVAPGGRPGVENIGLVEIPHQGVIDVFEFERYPEGMGVKPISSRQDAPEDPRGFSYLGNIVEVRRTFPDGLVVYYECDSGLTADMLRKVALVGDSPEQN